MIVGAGPNLGVAIARRFGREGFSVGLVSRNQEKLDGLAGELEADGITAAGAAADIRDSDGLAAAKMLDAGHGTILFTTGGAAIKPHPLRARVGVSFAGEVAYARMLHDELRDRGIHVGHTAIGGRIAPGGDHEPDEIAEVLWRHHTERSDFQIRLGID